MIHITPLLAITLVIILGLFIWLVFFGLRSPDHGTRRAPRGTSPMLVVAALFPAAMFGVILACIVVALAR